MASSEVEIVSSSNPFGCVLKDHNRREHPRYRDPNHPSTAATTNTTTTSTSCLTTTTSTSTPTKSSSNFQKNLKDIVRDHIQSCINQNSPKPTTLTTTNNTTNNVNSPDENVNFTFNSSPKTYPNPPPYNHRFPTGCCGGKTVWNRRNNNHRNQSKNSPKSSKRESNDHNTTDDEGEEQRSPPLVAPPTMSRQQARVLDRWAALQAKEVITTMEKDNNLNKPDITALSTSHSHSQSHSVSSFSFTREPSPAPSDSSTSSAPVSSLVQKWGGKKIFPHINTHNNPSIPPRPPSIQGGGGGFTLSRASSVASMCESCNSETESLGNPEPAAASIGGESESDSVFDDEEKRKEKERIRVADIIKKWPVARTDDKGRRLSGVGGESDDGESSVSSQQQQPPPPLSLPPLVKPLARLKIGGLDGGGLGLGPVASPRIRGRQAAADALARLEKDRYAEIQRLSERHPVTKFPQRGRIQSMLKLRVLRREVLTAVDHQRPQEPSPTRKACKEKSNLFKQHKKASSAPSSVDGSRERFSNIIIARADARNSIASGSVQSTTNVREASSTNDLDDHNKLHITMQKASITTTTTNNNASSNHHQSAQAVTGSNNHQKEPGLLIRGDHPCTQATTSSKAVKDNENRTVPQELLLDKTTSVSKSGSSQQEDKKEPSNSDALRGLTPSPPQPPPPPPVQMPLPLPPPVQRSPPPPPPPPSPPPPEVETTPSTRNAFDDDSFESVHEENPSFSSPMTWHDSASYDGLVFGSSYSSLSSWVEEEEVGEEEGERFVGGEYYEPHLDWISEVSRPRSYWEDRRQARYQEITERSTNMEIRQLIERGSVSAVLSSAFREIMDQLMMSCVQRNVHRAEIDDDVYFDDEEESNSMMEYASRNMPPLNEKDQQERPGGEEEGGLVVVQDQVVDIVVEEREENIVEIRPKVEDMAHQVCSTSQQDNENGACYEQTPSLQHPWSNLHYTDVVSIDSDHVDDSNPLPHQQRESLPNQFHNHGIQEPSSFKNGTSIDMEFIYDLRLHMVQMYREMAELRKSINSCMELQVKLQNSMKDDVSKIPGSLIGKDSYKKTPKNGHCRFCYDKKVDSLLYRCGHMCTCFECAQKLQCSSGECPICHAQILDVVRAHTDS